MKTPLIPALIQTTHEHLNDLCSICECLEKHP